MLEKGGCEDVEKPVTTPTKASAGMPEPKVTNVPPAQGRFAAANVLLPPELGQPAEVTVADARQVGM